MAQDEKGSDDRERDRLVAIYRGWRKALRNPMQFSWRKPDASGPGFFLLAGLLLFFVTPVDAALWGYRDEAHLWAYPLPVTGRALLWMLLPICLLNAFLIHRLLSRKTPADNSTRWQILGARWLAIYLARTAGLFFLGLMAGYAWRRRQTELLESLFRFAGVAGLGIIGLKGGLQALRELLNPERSRFSNWSPARDLDLLRQFLSMMGLILLCQTGVGVLPLGALVV